MRLKQAGVIGLGLVLAAVMVWLGLWQMNAYRRSGHQVAVERTQMEVIPLTSGIATDGTVSDIYARRVSMTGRYRPDLHQWVGTEWPLRVVTAFELSDGRLVAVVRGAASSDQVPDPPEGEHQVIGVFLASDPIAADPGSGVPEGTLGSVRLAKLAQDWPGRLISGYVTVSDENARDQGLEPPILPLPEVKGSPQNSGYALQWWVFAVVSIVLSILAARTIGRGTKQKTGPPRQTSIS